MDKQDAIRLAIGALTLSASGLVYIAVREDYSAQPYPDVGGVQTYGFGATHGVRPGDRTTPVRALIRLRADAGDFEVALKRCLPADVPLAQREWDAYVALAYNVGARPVCLNADRSGPSTIVRRLRARDYAGACEAIALYKYAGGQDCSVPGNKTCGGVWTDRLRLRAMCLGAPPP
jgi:GH24 family phage-related lysozyme (muramidase)